MVLNGFQCSSMLLNGFQWFSTVLEAKSSKTACLRGSPGGVSHASYKSRVKTIMLANLGHVERATSMNAFQLNRDQSPTAACGRGVGHLTFVMLRLKIICWSLLLLGTCFSSKLISCRVADQYGCPIQVLKRMLRSSSKFLVPILADIGKMDVRSCLHSGQRIEAPFQHFTKQSWPLSPFSHWSFRLLASCGCGLRLRAMLNPVWLAPWRDGGRR